MWIRLGALLAVVGACICACKSNDANAGQAPAVAQSAHEISSVTPSAASPTSIAVTVDDKGFTPSSASFKKGDKAQLVFTRTTDNTCATEVVFPEINIKKSLPLHQAVTVDVPTADARTLVFQCGMGMFKSSVVIH